MVNAKQFFPSAHEAAGIYSITKAMTPPSDDVTRLLNRWGSGDAAALDQLLPLVYRELRKIAKRYMRVQSSDHTLQSTAVVHEAFLKLVGDPERDWDSRAHFFAVAA